MALGFHTSVFQLCCGKQMGHKIKYGAKFFLKIKFFSPTFRPIVWGVMLPETNILFILALLYTPYISRTDIFAILDQGAYSRGLNFRIFCDFFITINSHVLKLKILRGLTREIRETKTTAKLTTYTVLQALSLQVRPWVLLHCGFILDKSNEKCQILQIGFGRLDPCSLVELFKGQLWTWTNHLGLAGYFILTHLSHLWEL